jgi:magnesium-transporting ATPase (P-type)
MQALKHFWSVYYSLARYTAGSLLLIVLLVLCSLAALLISLVLPWQLLTAIDGRSSVRWHWLIADQPVMAIGLIVLAAFVVHVLCEWAIGQVGKHGAQRLLDAHAKIGLPIGYQGKTRKYFMILARLLSSSILLLAVLFLLLWVYPSLALGMTVYLLVCSLLAVLAWYYPAFRVLVQTEGLSKYGWHLGFIFVLAWMYFCKPKGS